jgi:hypothetical protein
MFHEPLKHAVKVDPMPQAMEASFAAWALPAGRQRAGESCDQPVARRMPPDGGGHHLSRDPSGHHVGRLAYRPVPSTPGSPKVGIYSISADEVGLYSSL